MQSGNSKETQMYNAMKNRYVGIGDADTKRKEFIGNMKRDTYASLIGHDSTLTHLSVALNKPKRIIHQEMIDKMEKS